MNRILLSTVCVSAMLLGAGCKVVVTGSSTYDSCIDSLDCNDSFDSCVQVSTEERTDSQCTRSCVDDLDCPGSGHCVTFPGSAPFCYQTCITSGICDFGWGCTDLSDGSAVCLPGSGSTVDPGIPAYNECNPADDRCTTSVEGCFTFNVDGVVAGVCTSSCSTAAECPTTAGGLAGACISFSGGGFTCFESCIDSSDCLEGFACKSSLADGSTFPPICLPI